MGALDRKRWRGRRNAGSAVISGSRATMPKDSDRRFKKKIWPDAATPWCTGAVVMQVGVAACACIVVLAVLHGGVPQMSSSDRCPEPSSAVRELSKGLTGVQHEDDDPEWQKRRDAYVTLVTSQSYVPGALALGASIRKWEK